MTIVIIVTTQLFQFTDQAEISITKHLLLPILDHYIGTRYFVIGVFRKKRRMKIVLIIRL